MALLVKVWKTRIFPPLRAESCGQIPAQVKFSG